MIDLSNRRFISLAEALRALQSTGVIVTERTLRRWCRTGQVPAVQREGQRGWWIDVEELKAGRKDSVDSVWYQALALSNAEGADE